MMVMVRGGLKGGIINGQAKGSTHKTQGRETGRTHACN